MSNLVAQFSAMRTQMQNMSKLMQLGQDGGLGDEVRPCSPAKAQQIIT